MSPRTRAVSQTDKQQRRAAILAAADALVQANGGALASVADVAQQAGVAKGTVYLYFQTREEIFLSLHGGWMGRMFDRFDALFDGRRLDGAVIGREMARAMCAEPHRLMLASACHGVMDTHVEAAPAREFRLALAGRLGRSGGLLERTFAQVKRGSGARLLVRAYALTFGLWQLMHSSLRETDTARLPCMEVFQGDYPQELEVALIAYWRGALQPSTPVRRSR
jgi:AcrR family transcriptional regulator